MLAFHGQAPNSVGPPLQTVFFYVDPFAQTAAPENPFGPFLISIGSSFGMQLSDRTSPVSIRTGDWSEVVCEGGLLFFLLYLTHFYRAPADLSS